MAEQIAEPNKCQLEVAAYIAAQNWQYWKDCYEAPAEELKICEDPELFSKFVNEYSLLRREKGEDRERLRSWMTKNGRVAMLTKKKDGSGVENLLVEMKDSKFMRHRSFLSKIAAFSRPDVFIAYDLFARRGLVKLGMVTKMPDDYVTYLKAVRELERKIGQHIEKHLKDRHLPTRKGKAFQLRVLDVYLMMSGRRVMRTTSDEMIQSMKRNSSGWQLF